MRTIVLATSGFAVLTAFAQSPLPIIDMHLHALRADANGPGPLALCVPVAEYPLPLPEKEWAEIWIEWQKNPPCADPVWSPATDDALRAQTIEVLDRRNVIGVLSGTQEDVQRWLAAAPERFIAGFGFQFGRDHPSPDSLRRLHSEGRFVVLAEVTNQYVGIGPSDPRFEPYDALVRHPKLRIYIMHAGWPMLDDLLAVLWTHPQVYVELGGIVFGVPRAEFYRYLQRIVGAGFGKRVMFGSDQMVWPGVIEPSIQAIERAPFLSEAQKRDILYNNAARFLRLGEDEIAKHHGRR